MTHLHRKQLEHLEALVEEPTKPDALQRRRVVRVEDQRYANTDTLPTQPIPVKQLR